MRYVLGIVVAAGAVALAHLLFGLGDLPRPWSSVVLGVIGGLTLALVLSTWERLRIRRALARGDGDSAGGGPARESSADGGSDDGGAQ